MAVSRSASLKLTISLSRLNFPCALAAQYSKKNSPINEITVMEIFFSFCFTVVEISDCDQLALLVWSWGKEGVVE